MPTKVKAREGLDAIFNAILPADPKLRIACALPPNYWKTTLRNWARKYTRRPMSTPEAWKLVAGDCRNGPRRLAEFQQGHGCPSEAQVTELDNRLNVGVSRNVGLDFRG